MTTEQDPKTGVIREYYFGGDGPHCESGSFSLPFCGKLLNRKSVNADGVRNSSLALAEFRPHGLAGVGAAKDWITAVHAKTLPVMVTGPKMLLTVDSDIPNHEHLGVGYVVNEGTVTLWNKAAGLVCTVSGTNTTEAAVKDCDLTTHVNKELVFELSIKGGALLYTVGFSH